MGTQNGGLAKGAVVPLSEQIFRKLHEFSHDFAAFFEEQRKDYGAGHRLKNEVCHDTKLGAKALGRGELDLAEVYYYEKCLTDFQSLRELNLPTDKAWQLQNEAGQELVEFMAIINLYHVLRGDLEVKDMKIRTPEELGVTRQSWLAGIADAVSELEKIATDICLNNPEINEQDLNYRYLELAEGMDEFLNGFATTYAVVINNNRYPGQGYVRKLRTVQMSLLRTKKEILTARRLDHVLDRVTKQKENQI